MNRNHFQIIMTALLMACGDFTGRAGDATDGDDDSLDNLLSVMFGNNPDTDEPHESADTLSPAEQRVFILVQERLYSQRDNGTIPADVFTRLAQIGGDMNAGRQGALTYIAPDRTTAAALHALADATDWSWSAYENEQRTGDASGAPFRG